MKQLYKTIILLMVAVVLFIVTPIPDEYIFVALAFINQFVKEFK